MDPAPDCVLVVFGATGDLARRKLFPALHALHRRGLMGARSAIIGCSRSATEEGVRDLVRKSVKDVDPRFVDRVHAARFDLGDPPEHALEELARRVSELGHSGNVAFHLAIPPGWFEQAAKAISSAGLARGPGWRRLIVEKPFGEDEASARALDEQLRSVFDEEQIYRIDHFLGKDPVQNLFTFRGMNAGHEAIWNRDHVDHVQITVAEQGGIGTRADFYEKTGVVRDMLQNHLMQLLCLATMDLPEQWDDETLHANALAMLERLRPPRSRNEVVLGQYGPGRIDGDEVVGYQDEADVSDDSRVSTFVAARYELDHPRWEGVPFYLRTGKRLACDVGEIVLQLKQTPCPFGTAEPCSGNRLVFRLEPDPGIERTIWARVPGHDDRFAQVEMSYAQHGTFGVEDAPSAYEHLLFDVIRGDRLLFPRAPEVYAAWRAVAPVLDLEQRWGAHSYRAGSWGPAAADQLLVAEGRQWHAGSARAHHGVAAVPPGG